MPLIAGNWRHRKPCVVATDGSMFDDPEDVTMHRVEVVLDDVPRIRNQKLLEQGCISDEERLVNDAQEVRMSICHAVYAGLERGRPPWR